MRRTALLLVVAALPAAAQHQANGLKVGEVTATRVTGGWHLDVEVSGTYHIDVVAAE